MGDLTLFEVLVSEKFHHPNWRVNILGNCCSVGRGGGGGTRRAWVVLKLTGTLFSLLHEQLGNQLSSIKSCKEQRLYQCILTTRLTKIQGVYIEKVWLNKYNHCIYD